MKILFFLRYSRDQASSRVRGFYVVDMLRKNGINCDIIYGYDIRQYLYFFLKLAGYDIIYFQKRYSRVDLRLNKLARLMGKKTFFDIDDAPGGVSLNTKAEKRAIKMIEISSAVVVGSHKLLGFAKKFNERTFILPTPINLNYYQQKRNNENLNYITIGWIGNGINYKNDLLVLIAPLEELGEKYNIKVVIIGALEQKEIYQNFGKIKNTVVEIIDSIDWADPVAVPSAISNFDIGVYPLLNNEYNQYKCGFKALEYMAMEIPVLASPVGENKFIIKNGKDGFLVSDKHEWGKKITCLIENKDARKKMGRQGREKIEENYSTKIYTEKLRKIFKEIMETQK